MLTGRGLADAQPNAATTNNVLAGTAFAYSENGQTTTFPAMSATTSGTAVTDLLQTLVSHGATSFNWTGSGLRTAAMPALTILTSPVEDIGLACGDIFRQVKAVGGCRHRVQLRGMAERTVSARQVVGSGATGWSPLRSVTRARIETWNHSLMALVYHTRFCSPASFVTRDAPPSISAGTFGITTCLALAWPCAGRNSTT
jgi:hypothetical protein